MALLAKLLAVPATGLLLCACSEEPDYDLVERAIEGVPSEMDMLDSALVRAGDLSLFHGSKNYYEHNPELPPPTFGDGAWTFDAPDQRLAFSFFDPDGTLQRDPDDLTDRMDLELWQDTDLPGATAAGAQRSTTTRLQSYTVAIDVEHAQVFDFIMLNDDGTHHVWMRQHAIAQVGVVDRGPDEVPRYCPAGEVRGTSSSWWTQDVNAQPDPWRSVPDEAEEQRTFDFEAHFEGRELVWRVFDADEILDEGRTLTAFAEGC